jgi:hypothetical protein
MKLGRRSLDPTLSPSAPDEYIRQRGRIPFLLPPGFANMEGISYAELSQRVDTEESDAFDRIKNKTAILHFPRRGVA